MDYWSMLSQTVTASLKSGSVGTPLFVRWTASVAESKDVLTAQLAEMTAYTNAWLAATLSRLYATGTETQGHLCLALEYTTGSSALLALTLAHDRPQMNLAIYGNRGALYHNEHIEPIRDGSLAPQESSGSLERPIHPEAPVIMAAIDRSLALHQPVSLSQPGGQP